MRLDDPATAVALTVLGLLVYVSVVLLYGGLLARRLQRHRDEDRARARARRCAADQRFSKRLAHPPVARRIPVPRRPVGASRAGVDEH